MSRAIQPRGPIDARVEVPGSKSISNRALLLAALADGDSELSGVLDSDDIRVMATNLAALGASVSRDGDRYHIVGTGGRPGTPPGPIDVGASGTAARFLAAVQVLLPGPSVLDGIERMRERPIGDLLAALRALGADIDAARGNGCPPVRAAGGGLPGGEVEIDASRSSQYVSAVLQVAPFAQRDVILRLKDGVLVSRPYVDVTLAVMEDFGVQAAFAADGSLRVAAGQRYLGRPYRVEPDASTAAYFFAAAAITGGRAEVVGLSGASTQADIGLLDVLVRMGCDVTRASDSVSVRGPATLRAVDVDMNRMPDAVLALAVVAAFAEGESHLRDIGNLRIKESDRLSALEAELRKLGADAHAGADSLTIRPGPLRGAEIDTYDDHRMAMAFALAGLRVPGVRIRDPECVSKSWPGYFEALDELG